MKNFLAVVIFFLCTSKLFAGPSDIAHNSTCRINGIGTGVVFYQDNTDVWVLTAGHVITDDRNGPEKIVKVEFFKNLKPSHKMKAEIVYRVYILGTTDDVGFIKIKKTEFKDWALPVAVPLLASDEKVYNSEAIISCGCPGGDNPSHIHAKIQTVRPDYIRISSNVKPGRSGSAIFDKDCKKIYGIVIWQDGTAISHKRIHRALK